jgi:hypothetical protein
VRCRNSPVSPIAASTATNVRAPPCPTENSVCCPSGVDNGATHVSGSSAKARVREAYKAVSAIEAANSHNHNRVVNNLWNSPAISRSTSDHPVKPLRRATRRRGAPAVAGRRLALLGGEEREERLFQAAVVRGELV